jgi:hypothetical protein
VGRRGLTLCREVLITLDDEIEYIWSSVSFHFATTPVILIIFSENRHLYGLNGFSCSFGISLWHYKCRPRSLLLNQARPDVLISTARSIDISFQHVSHHPDALRVWFALEIVSAHLVMTSLELIMMARGWSIFTSQCSSLTTPKSTLCITGAGIFSFFSPPFYSLKIWLYSCPSV